ncbi:hypothetical protein FRC11_014727 [Ceratobasidium sp. 423]|nr:hypothetical protein FRC11_014727 [Ceratobasidium sp. 423]
MFRLLVFFPGKQDKRGRIWRNIPEENEMEDWFHLFLTALQFVSQQVPEDWQHAVEKTIEALPMSYNASKNLTSPSGQARSFITRRIEPEIMNRAFKVMRFLVDTTPKYALFRGYFFHLCGINLKLATQHIPGREDETPLNYAFQIYRFIDWCALNPGDIVADIGLAINMHRDSAPEELKRSTLLFRYSPLHQLLKPGYRRPQQDSYCHSHVIAGLRAIPLASVRDGGIIKIQAYPKDMVVLYKDKERSIGANFTVDEALGLGHRDKFDSQMKAFQQNQEEAGSYGLRVEERLTAWAANRLMQTNPRDVLERLVRSEVIVCHPTESVAAFKLVLSKTWSSIIRRQRELSVPSRRSPEVMLLTSALAYFLKGLVKRPDEMSASREMVDRLFLFRAAKHQGLPFIRSGLLDNDGLRVAYHVDAHTFKILFHTNVIIPGGQRIKSSRSIHQASRAPLPPSPPTTPRPLANNNPLWSNNSAQFLETLLNVHLPRAIWSYFPENRKASGNLANELRTKPLKRSHWSKVVEPLNTLLPISGKFMQSFDRLFPLDWKVESATGDFKKYDRDFLCRIRDHVDSIPAATRPTYSVELRRRIRVAVLASYDYLPVMHAHKMWAYTLGINGQRTFRISSRSS